MTRKLRHLSLFCTMLCSTAITAFSQDIQPIIDHYLEEAGVFAPIYNCKFPPLYRSRFTGTFYLESEDFYQGTVVYDGKLYTDVNLNLNVHLDELYIVFPQYRTQAVLLKDYVSEFTLGDMKFTKVLYKDWPQSPREGYFQILHDSNHLKVFKWTRKFYNQANPSQSLIPYSFDPKTVYFVIKDGAFIPVKNKSTFLKAIGNQKRALKDYISQHDFSFKKEARDESFAACAAYYDTL